MCRNIKSLYNFDPPATHEEIENASLQFVKKISGFNQPSKVNEKKYYEAVQNIAEDVQDLLASLSTDASPRYRDVELAKARERAKKRFG